MSPMDKKPPIIENSTTGTTINFSGFTKMPPKGFR